MGGFERIGGREELGRAAFPGQARQQRGAQARAAGTARRRGGSETKAVVEERVFENRVTRDAPVAGRGDETIRPRPARGEWTRAAPASRARADPPERSRRRRRARPVVCMIVGHGRILTPDGIGDKASCDRWPAISARRVATMIAGYNARPETHHGIIFRQADGGADG